MLQETKKGCLPLTGVGGGGVESLFGKEAPKSPAGLGWLNQRNSVLRTGGWDELLHPQLEHEVKVRARG